MTDGPLMGAAHRKTTELMHAIEDNMPWRVRELCAEIAAMMDDWTGVVDLPEDIAAALKKADPS